MYTTSTQQCKHQPFCTDTSTAAIFPPRLVNDIYKLGDSEMRMMRRWLMYSFFVITAVVAVCSTLAT